MTYTSQVEMRSRVDSRLRDHGLGRSPTTRTCPIFATICSTLTISYSFPLSIVLEHPVMRINRSFQLGFFVYALTFFFTKDCRVGPQDPQVRYKR